MVTMGTADCGGGHEAYVDPEALDVTYGHGAEEGVRPVEVVAAQMDKAHVGLVDEEFFDEASVCGNRDGRKIAQGWDEVSAGGGIVEKDRVAATHILDGGFGDTIFELAVGAEAKLRRGLSEGR